MGSGLLLFGWRAGWFAGGLVVAGGVDGELAEEFAGGCVDDPNLQVLGQEQDVGSGVGSAYADVADVAGDAQGDAAGFVDLVGADPVVGVGAAVGHEIVRIPLIEYLVVAVLALLTCLAVRAHWLARKPQQEREPIG